MSGGIETALSDLLARWESLAHLNSAVEKFCDELAEIIESLRPERGAE